MTAYRTALAAISAALVIACAQQPREMEPPAVSIPVPLIHRLCEHAYPVPGSGHWDGHVELKWNTAGEIVAIDCSYTTYLDGLSTTVVRVSLSDERARGLRDFLASRAGSR